jgi:hypothetical protein
MNNLKVMAGVACLAVTLLAPVGGYTQVLEERIGVEGGFFSRLDALEEDVSQLETDLDNETDTRLDGEERFQGQLEDERETREAQDVFLQSEIETLEAVSWEGDEQGNIFYGDGNVGIRTQSSPAEALTVNGNLLLTGEGDRAVYVGGDLENETNGRHLTIRAGDAFSVGSNSTRGGDLILEAGNGNNVNAKGFGGGDIILRSGANYEKGAENGGDIIFEIGSGQNAFIERMRIREGGNIGIGTKNPTSKLEVAGNVRAHSIVQTSDARLKTNIVQLTNVLAKLEKVRGVSFEWNEVAQSRGHSAEQTMVGVLAQEVETAFPLLVTKARDEGYKGVDHGGLTGILIEAVKELYAEKNVQIAALKAENADQQGRIAALEGRLETLEKERNVRSASSLFPSFVWPGFLLLFGGLLLIGGLALGQGWRKRGRSYSFGQRASEIGKDDTFRGSSEGDPTSIRG